MEKKQIVNIINFIRGIEPREEMDLVTPVREQIALLLKKGLKGTFLVQYDALLNPDFTGLLKALAPGQFELGLWFEVVEPLTKKAGIPWRGRYPWDWHAHCGFSEGYTRAEREALIDAAFEGFKDCFGFYPRSFGSWAFDAHTLGYAETRYGLDAACNCKDQWGTDGYTLWGGYYGQGYYPSRLNAFTPAQHPENALKTPIFRMLGSDPIYQYDMGLDPADAGISGPQGVVTLEPVYDGETGGGGVPAWVDWYLGENFSGRCLSFGYAQAGQENSFGWPAMAAGLTDQIEKIARLVEEGALCVETLGETGRWYRSAYPQTPPSVVAALSDWKGEGRKSVWYSSKNYRINLYAEKGRFWIRDLYLFREAYAERYLDAVCPGDEMTYDNLPVIDGARFSGGGVRAGLYPAQNPACAADGLPFEELFYGEEDGKAVVTLTGTPCGRMRFVLAEDGFTAAAEKSFCLIAKENPKAKALPQIQLPTDREVRFTSNGFSYGLTLLDGRISQDGVLFSGREGISLRLTEGD